MPEIKNPMRTMTQKMTDIDDICFAINEWWKYLRIICRVVF